MFRRNDTSRLEARRRRHWKCWRRSADNAPSIHKDAVSRMHCLGACQSAPGRIAPDPRSILSGKGVPFALLASLNPLPRTNNRRGPRSCPASIRPFCPCILEAVSTGPRWVWSLLDKSVSTDRAAGCNPMRQAWSREAALASYVPMRRHSWNARCPGSLVGAHVNHVHYAADSA